MTTLFAAAALLPSGLARAVALLHGGDLRLEDN